MKNLMINLFLFSFMLFIFLLRITGWKNFDSSGIHKVISEFQRSVLVTHGHSSPSADSAGFVISGADESGLNGKADEATSLAGCHNESWGEHALQSNSFGFHNTAVGFGALSQNADGSENTATGYASLFANSAGRGNTGYGYYALVENVTGNYNTALASSALSSNTTGSLNTASGYRALFHNTIGHGNTAVGARSLYYNSTQPNATALGARAGDVFPSAFSTFLGACAYAAGADYSNITAIGFNARPTASNQVRVGNSAVTSIGGYVGWTTLSDERFNVDVQENVPGLSFIIKLRPVTYRLNVDRLRYFLGEQAFEECLYDSIGLLTGASVPAYEKDRKEKERMIFTGFVAQDVLKSAKELGYDFSGVDLSQNDLSPNGLRYADFVGPLVKAVQELYLENEQLKVRLDRIESMLSLSGQTDVIKGIRQEDLK